MKKLIGGCHHYTWYAAPLAMLQTIGRKPLLIVPKWKSAPFWPILCLDGEHLAPFVQAWWSANYYPDMFLRGHSGCSLMIDNDCEFVDVVMSHVICIDILIMNILTIPYNRKYWQSLNLAVFKFGGLVLRGPNNNIGRFKFGGTSPYCVPCTGPYI